MTLSKKYDLGPRRLWNAWEWSDSVTPVDVRIQQKPDRYRVPSGS